MAQKIEVSKLARFLKLNDSRNKNRKIKDISSEISNGLASEIVGEKHIISKNGSKINSYVNAVAFRDESAQIRNLVFSESTTERDVGDIIKQSIEFLFSKNAKNIELVTSKKLEKLFKKINFEKIGEKENQIFMRYKIKKEVQYDLKKQFEDAELMGKVYEKTSEQLRKLKQHP
ncbi:MAG: hypothetical protein Q8Q42_01875 [Nanoarchaeota archaeon]|nr:hypothetical protein [Nanoarchaeota archaeon]